MLGRPEGKLSSLPGHGKPRLIRRDVARDMRVYANPLGRNSGTVWRCNVANYPGAHTATFPPGLVRPMILASCTSADDTVLDPFGGAGTVALVALQLGFKAITIDIFPDYTEEARNRLANAPAWLIPSRKLTTTPHSLPQTDELSASARGIDLANQVRKYRRQRGARRSRRVRSRRTARANIDFASPDPSIPSLCRVLRLFRHRQSYFPSCEPVRSNRYSHILPVIRTDWRD